MADYIQVNDYSVKDGLVSGDPAKVIRGSDIDQDFAGIAASIATKADAAGDGIALASNVISVDPSNATELLATEVDPDTDFLLVYDDSASAVRRVKASLTDAVESRAHLDTDFTLTDETTFTEIPGFTAALDASSTYLLDCLILASRPFGDISTMRFAYSGTLALIDGVTTRDTILTIRGGSSSTEGTGDIISIVETVAEPIQLRGIVKTDTAGNYNLSLSTGAGDMGTVFAGSFFSLKKIS